MRVKLRTILAGPQGTAHPGDVIDTPMGEQLIALGFAERVSPAAVQTATIAASENTASPAVVETAALQPPETAVRGRKNRN